MVAGGNVVFMHDLRKIFSSLSLPLSKLFGQRNFQVFLISSFYTAAPAYLWTLFRHLRVSPNFFLYFLICPRSAVLYETFFCFQISRLLHHFPEVLIFEPSRSDLANKKSTCHLRHVQKKIY